MSNPLPEPTYLRMEREPQGQGYRLEELVSGTPVRKGYVRLVCISDTHQRTAGLRLPPGDILIHAGDFTNSGDRREIENFSRWLGSCRFSHKVVIAGNHELPFDRSYMRPGDYAKLGIGSVEEVPQLLGDCTYLQDSATVVKGFKVYGSPWQPAFCDWAFNLSEQEQLREKWDRIPSDTDILITHGPPRGVCDLVPYVGSVGCLELSKAVQRVRPLAHIFGHIHEGHGYHFDGRTVSVNASICNRQVQPVNPPIVIDLPDPAALLDT